MLKTTMIAVAMLATVASANARELFECSVGHVQDTLQRVTRSIKVIATENVQSKNLEEERWCLGTIITAGGNFRTVAFTLRWTSATEGRYWLQTQAGFYR